MAIVKIDRKICRSWYRI